MMRMTKIFVPGHISGFWYVIESDDILRTGSLGAGLIIEPGLIIEYLDVDECKVVYNNAEIDLKTYRDGHEMADVPCKTIKVSSPYELGVGYGASAGVTIGGLYFSLSSAGIKATWNKVGEYAHSAEVLNKTGYGDVLTEIYGGGLELRISPGAPGIGAIDKVPVSRDIRVITIRRRKYSTIEMFRRYGEKIKVYGPEAYNKFLEDPSIEKFGEVSHWFSRMTGMMSRSYESKIKSVLKNEIRRGSVIDFFVKKSLLVIISDESGYLDVCNSLSNLGTPLVFTLNFSGCRILY